jgi:hypothetical protein
MSINEKTYHLINEYLQGQLAGSKLDRFKADLKIDSELRAAVKNQQAIISGIETSRENELKKFITANTSKKTKVFSISPTFKITMASAAAIALIVVAFFSINPLDKAPNQPTATTQESIEKVADYQENNKPQDTISQEPTTQVDTQTLAIVTPPIEPPQIEMVEDDEEMDDIDSDGIEEVIDEEPEEEVESMYENTTSTPDAIQKEKTTATDIVVGDRLLNQKKYIVSNISPDFTSRNDNGLELADIQVQSTTPSKPKQAQKTSSSDKDVEVAATESDESAGDYKSLPKREVTVEYWKSVVNYVGYKYNGSKVKLYGIDEAKAITFKELDNRLYVNLEGKQYFIEKNKKYNRMVEVTNPTLLKILNE